MDCRLDVITPRAVRGESNPKFIVRIYDGCDLDLTRLEPADPASPLSVKDGDAGRVVAGVSLESEAFVGFHRVVPLVLQRIRTNLVGQADPAPFLIQIQQDAAPLLRNSRERRFELRAAIAAT